MATNTNPFDELLAAGVRAGHIPERTKEARDWYRDQAKHWGHKIRQGGKEAGRIDYNRISERKIIAQNKDRLTTIPKAGNLYMFMYQAKHAEDLPYWDRFPLIFPWRVLHDRFFGINLHYLPLSYRAVLMDALHGLRTNSRFDETTKLRLNYQVLNSAAKFKYFKPCVKQYLFSHTKSQFAYVFPSEWNICMFLPLEKFQKKTKAQVWADSKKIIQGR